MADLIAALWDGGQGLAAVAEEVAAAAAAADVAAEVEGGGTLRVCWVVLLLREELSERVTNVLLIPVEIGVVNSWKSWHNFLGGGPPILCGWGTWGNLFKSLFIKQKWKAKKIPFKNILKRKVGRF